MSMRTTGFANEEYYHIYNRGNSKQTIFHDDQDHRYFITLLNYMNTESRSKTRFSIEVAPIDNIVSIGAFCLMSNHFHILLRQEKERGVTLFMQKLSTAYVMYYNKKYKRTGALFEGKFKSKYAGEDRYLKYLFAYIHLNPLKIIDEDWKRNRIEDEKYKYLLGYPYSSFHEYHNGEHIYTNETAFPDYFPSSRSFLHEINSWLKVG